MVLILWWDGLERGNQLAERLHNTIRERNKVQRAWKKDDTPLSRGQTIYCDFVRPHVTLEEKTPTEVAGIGIEGRNKRMEPMMKALNQVK